MSPEEIELVKKFKVPFAELIGLQYIGATRDRVRAKLVVRPDMCNGKNVIHGGAIMAFADTLGAVGTVLNMPLGGRTSTIESSTRFIAAAPVGTVVTGEAIALHKGRTTMVWQTTIRLEDGRLCAVVSQTQLMLAPKP